MPVVNLAHQDSSRSTSHPAASPHPRFVPCLVSQASGEVLVLDLVVVAAAAVAVVVADVTQTLSVEPSQLPFLAFFVAVEESSDQVDQVDFVPAEAAQVEGHSQTMQVVVVVHASSQYQPYPNLTSPLLTLHSLHLHFPQAASVPADWVLFS